MRVSHRAPQNADLGPNPGGFDWAGSADVAFFAFTRKMKNIYYVEVTDRHFGRVLCSEDELMLPEDRPDNLVQISPTDVPIKTYVRLVKTAADAVKEWL